MNRDPRLNRDAGYTEAAERLAVARRTWIELTRVSEDERDIARARAVYEQRLAEVRAEEDRVTPRAYMRPNRRREEVGWERHLFGRALRHDEPAPDSYDWRRAA